MKGLLMTAGVDGSFSLFDRDVLKESIGTLLSKPVVSRIDGKNTS